MSSNVPDVYADKYVVFLDLLGFKDKVTGADESPTVRQELLGILDILQNTLCDDDNTKMRFTHFSDCIIFSASRTAEGLWQVFTSIEMLACNLLNYDFLVRGGLVAGGIHHDKDFVYGSAVSRAYELERNANDPTILVSDEVVADTKIYGAQFSDFLIQDTKGRHFVHYLRSYAEYTNVPLYVGKVLLDDTSKRIIDFICNRLNTHTGDVLKKAVWFQKYWNDTVAARGVFGRIENNVTERDLGHHPTLIVKRRIVA